VLGSGVIGLTTALALLEASDRVRVVADTPVEATTSHLAAGIWFPTQAGPPDRVADWSRRTYRIFAAEAATGAVPGVLMRESLMLYADGLPEITPDWAASVGAVRPATAAELPPGYRAGLRFAVPLADMPVYLPWLRRRIQDLGAELITAQVESLDGLLRNSLRNSLRDIGGPTDAIVNCTGLAAREVAGDPSVFPVRGQIIRVTNPGLTMSVRDVNHPAGRAYVHPRGADCILGGTLEAGRWDTTVDPATADSIRRRCLDLVPALAAATVIEHRVGLRPARPTVRLEADHRYPSGPRIVHNYGHGGSGITLSRGCAQEVVSLLHSPVPA